MRSVLLSLSALLVFNLQGISQQDIPASEDSYVRGGQYAKENFGSVESIELKSAPGFPGYTRKGYLKFDLSSWQKEWISSAVLTFYASEVSSTFRLTASSSPDNWDESTITWETAPPAGTVIDSVELEGGGKSYNIEVSSAFLKEAFGDGTLSLVLSDRAFRDQLAHVNSRESGRNIPRILVYSGGDTLIESPDLYDARLGGDLSVQLRWRDRTRKETGYLVERKVDDGAFSILDTTCFNTEIYIDSSTETGHSYLYRVRAMNPFRNSGYSQSWPFDLSAGEVPAPVEDLAANAISSGKVRISWSHPGIPAGYIIYRGSSGVFEAVDSVNFELQNYTDAGLAPESTYRYFVRAYNYLGASLPSDTVELSTPGSFTYYFDAQSGDDSHPVNSKETPWQSLERMNELVYDPGDSLLLKAGSTWEGLFFPKGSGLEAYPITLSSYGTGPRPKLDGKGADGAVITLQNTGYWNLSNLEITNPASVQASRLGVLITADGGVRDHFQLENLWIHDVFGRYSFEMAGKNTGGIGIIGENDTRFNDILIKGCEISDVVRVGIFTNGNAGSRGDRPITKLVIRNNVISRCAGDGMIIRYADHPMIEHNLAVENHNAPEELVDFGVAIWVRSTDEAVIQYNRVFDTRGSMDAQAFDADLEAYRTLVQYNYTGNNEGGFMLVYGSSQDAIIRYNISQNDGLKGGHILDFPVWTSPRGSGIIHNNVFYIGEGIRAVLVDEALQTAKLYNNIVINEGGGTLTVPSGGQTAELSNNCLVGYPSSETSINLEPVQGNPELADPGSGDTDFSSLSGYMIGPGSPCIRRGKSIGDMNGSYWLDGVMTDFWGTVVDQGSPDVGVHQFSGPLGVQKPPSSQSGTIEWSVSPLPYRHCFFLSLNLPFKTNVKIRLYDASGRYVDTVFEGELDTGTQKLYYDAGRTPGAGVYFLSLTVPRLSLSESRTIVRY